MKTKRQVITNILGVVSFTMGVFFIGFILTSNSRIDGEELIGVLLCSIPTTYVLLTNFGNVRNDKLSEVISEKNIIKEQIEVEKLKKEIAKLKNE